MIDENKIKERFGKVLKKVRVAKGYSQEGLAELSGLHRTYISEVERGDRNLSLINIVKLCDSLDVTTSSFFEIMEQENE